MNVPATVYRTPCCQPTTTRVRQRVPVASTTRDAPTPVSPPWDEYFVSVPMVSSWRTTGKPVKVIEFAYRSFFIFPCFFFPWKRNRGKYWITSGCFLSDGSWKRDFAGFSIILNLVLRNIVNLNF